MLPVVPMFHVNALGTPYAAAMVGCTVCITSQSLDGPSLVNMIDTYKVTVALGVTNHLARFTGSSQTNRQPISKYEP